MDMAISSAAKELDHLAANSLASVKPVAYEGFQWWHALLVSPNKETQSADLLKRVHVFAYLPRFVVHVRIAHGRRRAVHRAVVPGMLFVPVEMMEVKRRGEVFDLCHVRGFLRSSEGQPARLHKGAIEVIREMEAKLYEPPPQHSVDQWDGKVGDRVRLKNAAYAAYFGDVVIKNVDLYPRISVQGVKLFGCSRVTWTTASEIEAM